MTTTVWIVLGLGGWVLLSVLVALLVGRMVRLRDQQRPSWHEDQDGSGTTGTDPLPRPADRISRRGLRAPCHSGQR